jgi:hypothetical protein
MLSFARPLRHRPFRNALQYWDGRHPIDRVAAQERGRALWPAVRPPSNRRCMQTSGQHAQLRGGWRVCGRYPRGPLGYDSFVTKESARCSSLCDSLCYSQGVVFASRHTKLRMQVLMLTPVQEIQIYPKRGAGWPCRLRSVTRSQNNRASLAQRLCKGSRARGFACPLLTEIDVGCRVSQMFVERVFLRLYMVHRLGVLPRAHKNSRGANGD